MKAKVLIVISAPLGGGAEKAMTWIHEQFMADEISSILVSVNSSNPVGSYKIRNSVCLNRTPNSGLFSTAFSLLRFKLLLSKIRPHVIIANCEVSELFVAFCSIIGIPIIIVEHANPAWVGREKLGSFVRRILKLRRTTFIAVSDHIKAPFHFHNYLRSIPNPIDVTDMSEIHLVKSEIHRLVYIGRLARVHKNPKVLIEIAQRTHLPIIYYGNGELMQDLFLLAEALDVDCEFKGWVSNPFEELEPNDLLIVPSVREGDGLVVVEAIVRRVPILMQDNLDLRRFGLPDINYCASAQDFALTIDGVESLFDLIPSNQLRTRLIRQRSVDEVCKQWYELLSSILPTSIEINPKKTD